MRLVYIVNRIDGPGGLERVLSIKASMLADHYNYDVHIITLNQKSTDLFYEFSSKLTYHDIEAVGNPIIRAYRYMIGLRRMIKKISPDVIAVCDDGLKGFFVPLIVGKPCPMIYERHVSKNATISNKGSFLGKIIGSIKSGLMSFGARSYNHFVVLTKGNLKEWKLDNIKVIPNPLSFYPENNSTLTNKKVLAVGKQSFQKGYDRLLQSWKQVINDHPDWTLDIYGTISKEEKLEELVKKLELTGTINFYPPVKNIGEKYQEASIYTMSSRYEGFGMVLTEAMAYGVPCVSFDCPHGPSDIITDSEDGFLVKNHDIDTFAEKVIHLIKNEEERIIMGTKARVAVKQYLPTKISKEWHELFVSISNT